MTERGARLYVNTRVHMKLYVFESNTAVSTSGNLTLRGLGYVDKPNIEVGNYVELTAADWINLYGVVGESRLMTPEIYARFEDYVASNQLPPAPFSPPADLLGPSKIFTLASLPATETPAALMKFYFSRSAYHLNPETARRGFHDLAVFEIQDSISSLEDFNELLGRAFRKNPFVSDFVSYLRSENSLRFGAVNAWIQQKCEDVPLPYRWEIKENTRIFYNWLEHYFPEITWDRPGHSQIIRWRE